MKIVVAIDSLKGSLTSTEAAKAIKEGILSVTEAEVVIKPLADGGEGTVEALISAMNGKWVYAEVTGPAGDLVTCPYGIIEDTRTAVIEIAGAAGIVLIPKEKRNPLYTTTFGVGEVILDAMDRGCRNFLIGIGGSATNDGGIGMLEALGFRFYDGSGNLAGPYGKDLASIKSVQIEHADQRLKECSFRIACDVNNPLCGLEGASYVFGPQKGATFETVEILDRALEKFAVLTKETLKKDTAGIAGTGAAGGLGYAFLTYLNAVMEPGISIIMDTIKLEEELKDADYVITGEGRLDFQTSMGKAPIGVARLAKKYKVKVLAFAGCVTAEAEDCNKNGIDAFFPILQVPMTAEKAMESSIAYANMAATARQVFRLIKTVANF